MTAAGTEASSSAFGCYRFPGKTFALLVVALVVREESNAVSAEVAVHGTLQLLGVMALCFSSGSSCFARKNLKFVPKTPQPQENLSAQLTATEPHGRQPTATEDARYHPSILGGANRARTTRTAAVLRRARATMRRAACLSGQSAAGRHSAKTSRAARRGCAQRGWSQQGERLSMRYRNLPKVVPETRAPRAVT